MCFNKYFIKIHNIFIFFMKYINFNIIKMKKQIYKKKSNVNETGLGIFSFRHVPFNFLNDIG